MESDNRSDADVTATTAAELRERAAVINRSTLAPHTDGSGVSWWAVVAASALNTVLAWLLFLIVRDEVLWLLWVLLLIPLAAPLGWSFASRLVRRRYGVAPAQNNQPRELQRFQTRAVILSAPLELGILALVIVAPIWVALPATFVASAVVFGLIWRAYERTARQIGASAG